MHASVEVGAHAMFLVLPGRRPALNIVSTALLALAMSTDAFAAAIGKGAALKKPSLREALRTGVIFGCIEAVTPLIGWAAGKTAAQYVAAWDHWIAFALLAGLGIKMIHEGLAGGDETEIQRTRHSARILAITAFATSIDAMAVGAGLAFIDENILSVAAAIGLATFIMTTIGVMLSRALGMAIGKRAEMAGGLVLICIGSLILYQHLSA
jgi:putative Mn2+ efflux pump MntP